MNHPLQCQCGTLKGYVPDVANRGVCYCKDCQAFAHFLECPGEAVLNESGGTADGAANQVRQRNGEVHTDQQLLKLAENHDAVVATRISGNYKCNPFFVEDSGTPIKQPRLLTTAERNHVTSAV